MNAYTKKVRDTSLVLYAALTLYNQKKAELEKKQAAGTIAAVDSMRQLEENAAIYNNAKIAHSVKLDQLTNEYAAACESWATPSGKDVTEDMALLTSGMKLSAEDYEKLEAKYKNNYTMLKAIKSNAETNVVSYISSASIDRDQKMSAFLELVGVAKTVYQGAESGFSLNNVIWEDESEFMKWYGELDRIIELG
jgi:hypothetical protein